MTHRTKMKLSTVIFFLVLCSSAMAQNPEIAMSDQQIHNYLSQHTDGQGLIYYMVPNQEIDHDTMDLLTQSVDVLQVDGTMPDFLDNVELAGITQFPWMIGFADKTPYYKGPFNDDFEKEFAGKNPGYKQAKDAAAKAGQDKPEPPKPQEKP